MAWEVYISEENLLGFIKWIKLWHDNSEMKNTFLSYYKWNRYWHEYRAQTNNSEENNNTENTNEEQEWNE